ncbi:MAG TPA: SPFH domain-containing protein [Spirochaetia bacterium]|nr:SPFH domain-containing protein [Spirochaetia bacterium]
MLKLIFVLVAVLGVGMLAWKIHKKAVGDDEKPNFSVPVVLLVVGLLITIALSASVQILPTQVGVVENTWTGDIYSLNPGTHIWPFTKSVTPLVTKVTIYSTMQQIIEIGSTPAASGGVSASSSSPGQPIVFFSARGWATVNKDTIIELHRKYGSNYLEDWVEKIWVSTLKQVQGKNTYDYVASKRQEMETAVETELQSQLLGSDSKTPLVNVSQLAIVDFDYDQGVNAYLDTVSEMQFQKQQASQQIVINTERQKADVIAAETNYLVTKRNSEAEKVKSVTTAEGAAEAKKLSADAEAYKIKTEADAQAKAIAQVQQNLTALYNDYIRSLGWNGAYPTYWMGEGSPLSVFNVPPITP